MHVILVIAGILLMFVNRGYCCSPGIQCATGRPMGFIFAGRDIPDSAFSASSSAAVDYAPHRARIDKYFASPCSWTSGAASPIYIDVSLSEPALAFGIVVRKRCDAPWDNQYVTSYKLQVDNGSGWKTMLLVDSMTYSFGLNDIQWFAGPVVSDRWRLVVLVYENNASLKFDLMGYV